jgi:hypothetical protein
MTTSLPDAGIPILTEIIAEPDEPAIPVLDSPLPPRVELGQQDIDVLDPEAISTWNEEELDRLEREITERVLSRILMNVDAVLEQRVRDNLADVLQTAVQVLAIEIRDGLRHSLKDMVTSAVAHEITQLRDRKN